ncbi:MAG: hypothetical protein MK025_07040 [Acidobacteriia bacterium]|nr:hypothetical protein [Terriglobia bacterium]
MVNRRKFLQTIGSAAPVSLVSASSELTAKSIYDEQADEPRVFVREDFHHMSGIAPPLTRADVTKTVDLIAGTAVNTLIFSLAMRGGMCLYDTHVGQMHGTNVTKWTHPVNYRDGLHVRQLLAEGWDRPQLFCERCHEKGILFFASAHLNLGAGASEQARGTGRLSDFVLNSNHLRVGKDNDPRAKYISPMRLNFIFPEVREERLRIYEELLSRYETDGIEVHTEVVPICKFSQVSQCAPLLTQWFRELKKIAEKAEKKQARRKRIYARIPANPQSWDAVGFEVDTWISEGLVDGLICASTDPEVFDQDLEISKAVSLTKSTSCRILAESGTSLVKRRDAKPTAKLLWAAAANGYHQGAAGFGLHDMVRSQELTFLKDMYDVLRPLGSPELLAGVDKIYHVRDQPRSQKTFGSGVPGVRPVLPQSLEEGKPQKIPLRIADDLQHMNSLGRVKVVKLRLRLVNLEPSRNQLKIELNDKTLPDDLLNITDLNYRFVKEGVAYQGSQIYEYRLAPDFYPKPGRNWVKVTLLNKDPDVDITFQIGDLDCSIEYRLHRHFERHPIKY